MRPVLPVLLSLAQARKYLKTKKVEDIKDIQRMQASLARKGFDFDSIKKIAQNYTTAVENAEKTIKNLLPEGLPSIEDTDERNKWLYTKCKTFSTVSEAIDEDPFMLPPLRS